MPDEKLKRLLHSGYEAIGDTAGPALDLLIPDLSILSGQLGLSRSLVHDPDRHQNAVGITQVIANESVVPCERETCRQALPLPCVVVCSAKSEVEAILGQEAYVGI